MVYLTIDIQWRGNATEYTAESVYANGVINLDYLMDLLKESSCTKIVVKIDGETCE